MALTKQQIVAREGKLTASQVSCLMRGDKQEILNLWRLLVGDPEYKEPDLSDIWAINLGEATEALNLYWFSTKYGQVSRRGEVVCHEGWDWAACTLDGWSDTHKCPIETKHCGGFEKLETLIARYMPQIHWQMLLTGSGKCALSIIQGAREPVVEFIPFDADYAAELLKRANEFMEHVRNLTPPVVLDPVEPPVVPTKEYDMRTNNAWVSAAADWLENRLQSKKFDDATKELKGLTPNDCIRATGGGVVSRRDKAGRIRIVGETDAE